MFSLSDCRKLYDPAQYKRISLKMKFVSEPYEVGHGYEKQLFFMNDVEAVLDDQLRLATDSHVQVQPMLDQSDTVSTSKESTAHPLSTADALSVYSCFKSNILRPANKPVLLQKNVAHGSSFVGTLKHLPVRASRLKANATVAYRAHLGLLNLSKTFGRFLIDHGCTYVALLRVATLETITNAEVAGAPINLSNITLCADVPFF